jgi:CubicO group peptidase (beta-lactamase class C family)/peptidoglycan/LPS O-acetylase OafA/YrhL
MVWHTVSASWLTFFAAIPLMFFVGGSLLSGSLDGRSYGAVVLRRARRLLIPLWLYGAVVAAVGAAQAHVDGVAPTLDRLGLLRGLTWVIPLVDPVDSEWHAGWLSGHLWYLRAYLWLVLLAPLLVALARRMALTVPMFVVLIVVLEIARVAGWPVLGGGQVRVLVGDVVTYGFFVMLGMAYRRRAGPVNHALLAAGAVVAGAGAALYAVTAGLPEGGVNASYPAVALTGLAWLLAAGAAERTLRRVAEVASVRGATELISRRAVTIYLWHPAAVVVSYAVLESHTTTPVPFALVLAPALTALAVLAVGFVEDIAAGRHRPKPAQLHWPTLRGAAFAPAIVAVLVVATPLLAEPFIAGPAVASASTSARSVAIVASPVGTLRPPSYRGALGNAAFSGDGRGVDISAIRLRNGRMPARQLQRALDRWRNVNPSVRAVTVSVVARGKQWSGESHQRGVAPHVPTDPYQTASLSKLFTATLVLGAAEARLIDLDAPVPPIPGIRVPRAMRGITPRQLLQHTSGLVDYLSARGYAPSMTPTPQQAVSMSLSTPALSPPGQDVHYSNSNYLYLGLLLEHVTGRPYGDFVGYLARRAGLRTVSVRPVGPGRVGHASGGVYASPADLARFADALFTPGRLLPTRRVAQLTTLDGHNLCLGTWPLCPCWSDFVGTKRYSGIGHHVGHGGVYYDPRGMTVAIHVEPHGEQTSAQVESLDELMLAVLRR